MSDTTAEEKSKPREPAKKGLHGWKAALAVFGCGTFAAFGVFGVIVGVLSLLVSTASSGFPRPEEQGIVGAQSAQPREELEPGALNLCDDYLPNISDIDIEETVETSHSDDALSGSSGDSGRRLVSGECKFKVVPRHGTTGLWHLDFSFDVVVNDSNSDRDQVASEYFLDKVNSSGEYFQVIESGEPHDWADRVQSFYGRDALGVSRYLVVAQTRSATYRVIFSGEPASVEGGEVPEFDFKRQSKDLVGRLNERLYRVIPG